MSVAELLHSNLCLLGYEKEASGSKIILSDETFEHANERAFQSVLHFLLRALDEERCRQTFRHCWPVLDKRQAAVFRQAVVAWLKEIKQSDPDAAGLPLINPALFLSPGGRRFKDLLLALTQFVMVKSVQNLDCELSGSELILGRGDGEVQCGTLRAACALSKERFIQLQKTKLVAHSHHQRFADSSSAQYRRLRQSVGSLTLELGRMVAVSDLPPELTHRLLQETADQVVPAVYGAARENLLALAPGLERLRQLCREAEYSWQVADSIVSGAVAESVVDGRVLVAAQPPPQQGDAATQSTSSLLVDGRLDLVAFFDMFVDRVEHLRQFVTHCPVSELRVCAGLHGALPPLVREAARLSGDAGRLLAELRAESESSSRRVDRLLAAEPPPPPPPPARAASPPPLLAPRTPSWSLSSAPSPPPGDHPLKHMYRSPAKDGVKLDLELSADGELSTSSRISSLTTVTAGNTTSPWASPAAGPRLQLAAPTPAERVARGAVSPAAAAGGGRQPAAPDALWLDGGRLTPTPGATGRLTPTPGATGRCGAELSSCSSLFSPVGGQPGGGLLSPSLGSVSSPGDSASETTRPGGDVWRSPAAGSLPAEVARLRERSSALIRSLTRSPGVGGESGRPAGSGRSSPLTLQLSTTGGGTPSGPSSPPTSQYRRSSWQEEKRTGSGRSSPRAVELPRTAWRDGRRSGSGPSSPVALELSAGAAGGRCRRRAVSGPGSPGLLEASAAAKSSGRPTPAAADPAANHTDNLSQLEDQMAEALALSVFGPGDFNNSLDFSHRESLGGVELSLVQLDDSDCDAVPGPGPGPGRVEPPTDVLIDI